MNVSSMPRASPLSQGVGRKGAAFGGASHYGAFQGGTNATGQALSPAAAQMYAASQAGQFGPLSGVSQVPTVNPAYAMASLGYSTTSFNGADLANSARLKGNPTAGLGMASMVGGPFAGAGGVNASRVSGLGVGVPPEFYSSWETEERTAHMGPLSTAVPSTMVRSPAVASAKVSALGGMGMGFMGQVRLPISRDQSNDPS